MNYQVVVMPEAEGDLFDIYQYIIFNDSANRADSVLDNIEKVCRDPATFPGRGHYPPELDWIGVRGFARSTSNHTA